MKKVLAVGIFDGVHAGHQQIIAAAKIQGEVTVMTFDPHPTSVVAPERTPSQLMSTKDRIQLLKAAGASFVEVVNFTKEFSLLSPDQFIEDVLVGRFGAEHVVIGENFNFGHKAQGTPKYLSEVGPKYGFGVSIVKLQEDRGSTISSTRIRSLIIDGQIERANELLTRMFYLKGQVVHGEKRGREIGYPTANLGLHSLATIPADGVYAGWLSVGSSRWPAAISIGTNPTFPGVRGRQVEAYAIDQIDLELYDQDATVEFGFRLRDTLKFDGLPALLEQMKKVCGDVGDYVFLVDTWGQPMFDETAKIFDGISFNAVLVFGSDWIDQAKARELKVFIWTARAEDAEESTDEYFAKFVLSGADGVFADHPDLLREVADGISH